MSDATELKATGIIDWKSRSNLQFVKTDLFDRVINLRLICGNTASEQVDFVLRSDYETYVEDYVGSRIANVPVVTGKRKAIIRRCSLKPSIKVQYKQVSGNTAIDIDIFIQNFFVLSSDGRTLMQFSQSDFPLNCVEVQMGYFGQWNELYGKSKYGVPTAEQFFKMEAPEDVQTLFCNVQYVQTDNLPPDYTLHIHGYVGSCYNESVKTALEKESVVTETTEDYGVVLYNKSNVNSFKSFQHYLFNNVTRRFLRKTVSFTDKGEQKSLIKSVATDKNGLMDYETAKQYGVRVFISEGIQKHYKFNGKEVVYDSEGKKTEQTSFFSMALSGKTPMDCLNSFASRFASQEIRVFPCTNGDYMLCTKKEAESPDGLGLEKAKWYVYDRDSTGVESDSDGNTMNYKEMGLEMYTFAELSTYIHASMKSIGVPTKATLQNLTEKKAREKSFVRKKLPAVYNIATDALTTIVCPFFWFLSPFESIMFRSRYALGGVTGYYADFTAKDQYFMMLWQTVSFSTVENVNDVQMVCSTIQGEG